MHSSILGLISALPLPPYFGKQAEASKVLQALTQPPLTAQTADQFHPQPITWERVNKIQNPFLGEVEVYRFSNGQELYAIRQDKIPLASFGVLYNVGSADERSAKRGISHLLEHLIILQTDDKQGEKQLKDVLTSTGGQVNAFTTPTRTFYYSQYVPSKAIDKTIATWAKALERFSISEKVLEKEKETVVNEINEKQDQPATQLVQKLLQKLWPDKPAYWGTEGIAGTANTVKPLSKQDVFSHYESFYGPNNRKMILVGDFDLPQALATIAQSFNKKWVHQQPAITGTPIKSGSALSSGAAMTTPAKTDESLLEPGKTASTQFESIPANVEMAHMYMGLNLDLRHDKNNPGQEVDAKTLLKREVVFTLLNFILASHRNSRLTKRLVEDEKVATDISLDMHTVGNRYALLLEGTCRPENIQKVETGILQELQKVRENGVTQKELDIARKNVKFSLANIGEMQTSHFLLLTQGAGSNRPELLAGEDLKTLDQLTVKDIQDVLSEFLDPKKLCGVYQVPKENNEADSKNLNAMPMKFSGRLTDRQKRFTLAGGGELIVEETPGKPILSTTMIFRGGNPSKKNLAVASVLSRQMSRGTAKLLPQEHEQQLLEEGIRFNTSSGDRNLVFSLTTLAENKAALFKTLKQYLQEGPAFNRQSELDFVRKQTKDAFRSILEGNPEVRMQILHAKHFYPEGHEHGKTPDAILEQQEALSLDDIKQHYQAILRQPAATIAITGDVKAEEVKAAFDDILSGVDATKPHPTDTATLFAIPNSRIHTVPHKGAQAIDQVHIKRSWVGPGDHTDDRYAMVVLNAILSGGLSSRLFKTFRDNDAGLCYSVHSGFGPSGKKLSRFDFTIDTSPDKVKEVLKRFQQEVQKLVQQAPTSAEMSRVQNLLKSERVIMGQSTMVRNQETAVHRATQRPNMVDTIDKLLKVTPEDVQRVANRYLLQPSVTTIYADPKHFEATGFKPNQRLDLASDEAFLSAHYDNIKSRESTVQLAAAALA